MKNKMFVLILSVLLISVFSPSVFAQDTVVRIETSSVTLPPIAELFSVDVVIENGRNVAGCQVWIDYDSSALRYVDGHFKEGDYFPADAFYGERRVKVFNTKNRLQFAVTPSPLLNSGDGIIAALTFKVRAVKDSSLKLVIGDPDSGTGTLLSDVAGNLTAPSVKSARVISPTGRVCVDFSLKTGLRAKCVAYSPDGSILASSSGRLIHLRDSRTGKNLYTIDEGPKHEDIYSIAFSPKDNWFAIGGSEGKIRVWKRQINQTWVEAVKKNDPQVIHVGRIVYSVAFSHDDTRLACGKSTRSPPFKTTDTIDVWKLNSTSDVWQDKLTLNWHKDNVNSVAFHPKNKNFLASASNDKTITTWDVREKDYKKLQVYKGHSGYVSSIAFSPNGDYLASGCMSGSLIWWKVGNSEPVKILMDPPISAIGTVYSVVFESNTVLLSGGYEKKIHRWVWNGGDPKYQTSTDLSSTFEFKQRVHIWSLARNPTFDSIAIGTSSQDSKLSPGIAKQFTCTEQGNFTTGGGRIDTELVSLQISPNLISHVAYGSKVASGENYTYFILDPQFARVPGVSGIEYGNCTITLDTSDYDFFIFPLIDEEENKPDKIADLLIEVPITIISYIPKKAFEIFDTVKSIFNDVLSIFSGAKNIIEESEEDLKVTIEPAKSIPQAILESLFTVVMDGKWKDYSYITYPNICLIKGKLASIDIRIEQDYSLNSSTYTVTYEGTWNLENSISAAPRARPMSLTDYLPFQQLPPEVQKYLLQHFREFANIEAWQIPETTTLLPNYPNPFNPETWIPYQLANPADVTLTIYDINGRVVRDLDLGHQRAGVYQSRARAAHWDGRNAHGEPVASGLYFYTLKAGDFTATRKMLIRK